MGNTRVTSRIQDFSASNIWNLPPSNVFSTALTADQHTPIELQWPPVRLPNSSYYIALYFADDSFADTGTFDVFINDYSFYHNLRVTSSGLVLFAADWKLSGLTKIVLSPLSSEPPVINAGEVFGLFPVGGTTLTRDGMFVLVMDRKRDVLRLKTHHSTLLVYFAVIALDRIRKSIQNLPVDWNGDPCMPREYSWSGVACSEGPRIRVIAL